MRGARSVANHYHLEILLVVAAAAAACATPAPGAQRKRVGDATLWRLGSAGPRAPVLLLCDLGAPAWTLEGLARVLRGRGREVVVAEFSPSTSVDDLFVHAGPAALREALAGRARAELVGHGVGGALAYWLAAAAPERVAAVASLGAPARWTVPNRLVERALAGGVADPTVLLYDGVARERRWGGFPLARVAPWLRAGDLHPGGDAAGYLAALARVRAPVLAWCGAADNLVPREACQSARELMSAAVVDARPAGRIEAQEKDYSHAALVVGPRADEELFPAIAEFLDAHAED